MEIEASPPNLSTNTEKIAESSHLKGRTDHTVTTDSSPTNSSHNPHKHAKQHSIPSHISTNNNNDLKMPNASSNHAKQLSFFRPESDEDEHDDIKSPARKVSEKWLNDDERTKPKEPQDEKANSFKEKPTANPNCNTYKSTQAFDSDHDDPSTTSSCSCEDHTSTGAKSEDVHGDLDYDEDSVAGSPNHAFNSGPKIDGPSLTESSKCKTDTDQPDYAVADVNRSDSTLSLSTEIDGKKCERDTKLSNQESNNNSNNTRIRSVINFNHINDPEPTASDDETKLSSYKSSKSYDCLMKYFFKDACYFQIKSINHENVEISKSLGVWSTPMQNEIRFNSAFRDHRNVILIFSVQQSGAFQGFARMTSESRPATRPVPWVLPQRLNSRSLGGVFKVEWLCTKELTFHETHNLHNPYNGNKPVKIARDGQQVEAKIGKKLCKLFPEDNRERLLNCVSTLKRQVSERKKLGPKKEDFYPLNDHRGYPEHQYHGPHAHGYGHPIHPQMPPHMVPDMGADFGGGPGPGYSARPMMRPRGYEQPRDYYSRHNLPMAYSYDQPPYRCPNIPPGHDGHPADHRYPPYANDPRAEAYHYDQGYYPSTHMMPPRPPPHYPPPPPGHDSRGLPNPEGNRYHPYYRARR